MAEHITRRKALGLGALGFAAAHLPFLKNLKVARAAGGPTISTVNASNVTETDAHLSGTVNPNGVATSAHIEYGTTTSYGTNTATQDLGPGTSPVTVAADVSGLTVATTYHVRIVATQ